MEKKNNEPKQYYINLKVEREQDLYNPFDPEKNLSEDVKGYIMNKLSNKHGHSAVRIRIIHREPVREKDVRDAFSRWVEDSKTEMKRLEKRNIIKMLWLFAVGIAIIAISLIIQSTISALLFTIITTVGTFSIWEGGNIWIMAGPELRLQQMIFKRLIKSADIEFISEDTLEKDQAHSREEVPL